MNTFVEFLKSEQVIALITAVLIFFVTILLVVKGWIRFGITFLLLVFSLGAGLAISSHGAIRSYLQDYNRTTALENQTLAFNKQLLQAVEDLKIEIGLQKETLRLIAHQVQDVFDQVDLQKQKLQIFLNETRDLFKSEHQSSGQRSSSSLEENKPINLSSQAESQTP